MILAQSSSLVFFGYDKPLLFELETEKTRIVLSYMVNVKSFLNNILLYLPLTATFTTLSPFPRFTVGTTSYGLAVRISGFHSVDPGSTHGERSNFFLQNTYNVSIDNFFKSKQGTELIFPFIY